MVSSVYLVMVLLSIPSDKLPCFVSRPMAPGLNCVPINDTTPAMNSTNATLLTTLSLDGTVEDFLTTLQMEDSDYTVDGTGATLSPFQGKGASDFKACLDYCEDPVKMCGNFNFFIPSLKVSCCCCTVYISHFGSV